MTHASPTRLHPLKAIGPFAFALVGFIASAATLFSQISPNPPDDAGYTRDAVIRVAVFNASLYRNTSGGLIEDLATGQNEQAQLVAETIQRVRPDILLLCEFDYDADEYAATLFQELYLAQGFEDGAGVTYSYRYSAPVNTGVPSGLDLDRDGTNDGPADGWGFGRHPGQYGMLVLSKFPIQSSEVRTFRHLLWGDLPEANQPIDPDTGQPWYQPEVWRQLRLSSKSHWVVPIETPQGLLHLFAAHPTPPVFDGPEDRNGRRNHDEITLLAALISDDPVPWLVDDQGRTGAVPSDARFIIAGDLNADPHDGSSYDHAIRQLTGHAKVNDDHPPRNTGGAAWSELQGGVNPSHIGEPAEDTADFNDNRAGNTRVDYVLPSRTLDVLGSGIVWPGPGDPLEYLNDASDHRLVWIDVGLPSDE